MTTNVRRRLALSDHPAARALRGVYHFAQNFSLPAPAFLVRPILALFLALRAAYYFGVRVFVCEPLFKGYCTTYGRGLRTGVFIHWVTGGGRLIIGDHVLVDGKCSFAFAVRYAENPTLSIGDHTIISHGCSFTIGRQIAIGNHCLIASGVQMFDAPGHPTDPALRKRRKPAKLDDVRPIQIADNVWVGRNAIICPGVTIGEGSVVAVGSLVTSRIPPYVIVAGNPARVIGHLSDGTSERCFEQSDIHKGPIEKHFNHKDLDMVLEVVREVVCQVVGIQELKPDDDFYDAGLTSIMVLPLLSEIEDRFRIAISEEQFLDARTARSVASVVEAHLFSKTE